MNIPLLSELVYLIEGVFKHTAPEVAHAVAQAAANTAVQSAEQDPKVREIANASAALLTAAQNLKTAINTPPPPANG